MRRLLPLIPAALALSAAVATPASAGDLLYPGGTLLTEPAIGKPVWMIQAQCAGFFGATSNVFDRQGDTKRAEEAKTQGVTFFNDSLDRLMRDRALDRPTAVTVVSQAVDSGRAEGFKKIKEGGGFESRSHWNVARSTCFDVADVYKNIRYR